MPAGRPGDWHIECPVSNITSGCFSNRILLHLDRQKQTRQVICVQMCLLLSVSPGKIFRVILVCRRLLPSYTSAVCICAVFQSHWCLLFIQCCQTRSSFLPLRENHWTVRKHWHLSLWKCGIKLSKECLSGYAKLNVLGAAIHLSLLYKFPCVLRQQTVSGNCLHFCLWRHRVIEMPLPQVTVTVSIKKKKILLVQ